MPANDNANYDNQFGARADGHFYVRSRNNAWRELDKLKAIMQEC